MHFEHSCLQKKIDLQVYSMFNRAIGYYILIVGIIMVLKQK